MYQKKQLNIFGKLKFLLLKLIENRKNIQKMNIKIIHFYQFDGIEISTKTL